MFNIYFIKGGGRVRVTQLHFLAKLDNFESFVTNFLKIVKYLKLGKNSLSF